MQLFQQTQLATQQAYLRALHELESMQDSITAQEQLIEHINRIPGVQAEPSFSGYQSGSPCIRVQIGELAHIPQINSLIELHGWQHPIPHAETIPYQPQQTWLAHARRVQILVEDNQPRRTEPRAAFAIDYILTPSEVQV